MRSTASSSLSRTPAPVRVALVEDDPAFAAQLIRWVHETPGFCITAHHTTAESALKQLPAISPDLAIVDLKLPGLGGVEFIRQIKRVLPNLTCVVLTQFSDSDLLFAALTVGADSYLLKHESKQRILEGLRIAHAGGAFMTPSIGRKVLEFFQRPKVAPELRDALSPRQIEVLQLARGGKTDKEVARALGRSPETVRTHFRNIYRKLQVSSRAQAVNKTFKTE